MTKAVGDDHADLTDRIVHGLRELAPVGWQRLDASFAVTVAADSALLTADCGAGPVRFQASEALRDAVHRHRVLSADSGDGPWWRLLVRIDADGAEVVADRGAEPFPGEQLFAPEAYLADLEHYPRQRIPVWLAAYIGRGVPQSRPPRLATERSLVDERTGVHPVAVTDELPDLSTLWARWAVLSAAFVAAGSQHGPRVVPSVGMFESAARCGAILTLLPGDRAVLSGGVWNAPELDAAYNSGAPMPNFFAGAPDWVADPVLDPRVAVGLLSFCYWWDNGQWYRGESAPMSNCAPAMPAIWTADTVTAVIGELSGEQDDAARIAADRLVTAAQCGSVTRGAVAKALGENADIAGALYQFMVAGLLAEQTGRVGEMEAIDRVRDHIRQRGYDTTDYPLSGLRADRIDVGWLVRSPVPPGVIAVDRAVFYVADDGVVERSTSSVPLSEFTAGFARRYRSRQGGRVSRNRAVP